MAGRLPRRSLAVETRPRLAKYALRSPWSTAGQWLSAHVAFFPA